MAALRLKLAACTLSLGILTGCTPTTPSTPLPEPSPTCTPEAGGPPTPCTQYQHDQMIAKDKLYAQAETVYRKFLAEDERIYRIGGVTEPTPVLLETTTGEYLASSMSIYNDLRKLKVRIMSGSYSLGWVRRTPGHAKSGSLVAMSSCLDASKVTLTTGSGGTEPGSIVQETAFFVLSGEALKIAAAESQVVTKC